MVIADFRRFYGNSISSSRSRPRRLVGSARRRRRRHLWTSCARRTLPRDDGSSALSTTRRPVPLPPAPRCGTRAER